jgi:hypothetical protein
MSRRDSFTCAPARLAAALALLIAGVAPLVATVPPAAPAPPVVDLPAAPTPPPPPRVPRLDPAAAALAGRYEIEELADGVLLRPRDPAAVVRSIEFTEDGEVLVNGKEFEEQELAAFLGEDGRHVAALARRDFDGLREAFGFVVEPAAAVEPGDLEVGVHVDVPGVPRIRVRGSREDRVSVGRSIHIAADESARDVVCVGCSIEIEGAISGEAVAVGGSVRVLGSVARDVVAVGGSVEVEDGGEVGGEATAIGGGVDVAEGGSVLGRRSSIGVGPWFGGFGDDWDPIAGAFSDAGKLLSAIFRTGVLALLGVLSLLLMRPAVERAARRASDEPWKAVLAGLLLQLFFLPVLVLVTVVLAVSVIGIPLLALVPVAVLALVIAALLGFVAIGRNVGAWIEERFGARFSSPILAVVVGIVAIQGISLLGRVVSLPGGIAGWIGFALVACGFFVKYVAWTVGMGAMTLVVFGRDWRRPRPVEKPRPESADSLEKTAVEEVAPEG